MLKRGKRENLAFPFQTNFYQDIFQPLGISTFCNLSENQLVELKGFRNKKNCPPSKHCNSWSPGQEAGCKAIMEGGQITEAGPGSFTQGGGCEASMTSITYPSISLFIFCHRTHSIVLLNPPSGSKFRYVSFWITIKM